jgi:hypothetical protein
MWYSKPIYAGRRNDKGEPVSLRVAHLLSNPRHDVSLAGSTVVARQGYDIWCEHAQCSPNGELLG